MNYYQILGVSRFCTVDDIKKAYKKLAVQCHPDKTNDTTLHDKFKIIVEAYNILSHDDDRKLYDIKLNSTIDFNRWGQAFGKPNVTKTFSEEPLRKLNKGSNVIVNVSVRLSEVKNSIEKLIEYDYLGVCNYCSGTTYINNKKCCDNGCVKCDNKGYINGDSCDKCLEGLTYMKTKINIKIPDNDFIEGACFNYNCYQVIYLKTNDIPILIHELSHATHNIINFIGENSNSETFAYIMQYLTSEILKKLTKY